VTAIDGENGDDYSGFSVALSSDGIVFLRSRSVHVHDMFTICNTKLVPILLNYYHIQK